MTPSRSTGLFSLALVATLAACGSSDETSPLSITIASAGRGGAGSSGATGASGSGGTIASGGGTTGAGASGAAGKSGGAGTSGGGLGGAGGGGGGAGLGGAAGQGGAPVPLEDVHVSGRTEGSGGTWVFAWSGVSFATSFSGTGLSVVLEDGGSSNEFEVVVDGTALPDRTFAVTSGMHAYTVVDQLAPGDHTAEIHRRTEGSFGTTTFYGFEPQGGAIVPSPSPWLHRIEIVGDSITCGYGTECTSATEAFSSKTENHFLTYGAIAGRSLSADVHTIAWSGKGLVANYGTDTSATMPELYPRTVATASSPAWDFSSWVADAVVIDLGTNDWHHSPPVDPATFEAALDAFATTIEGHYPGVLVFGIGNALLGSSATTAVKNAMSGKPNRHYVEFAIESGEGVCCEHPCATTHARWGDELTKAIRAATGW